ncbi:uncharacterized, partial [Tachysurus ichikawai]
MLPSDDHMYASESGGGVCQKERFEESNLGAEPCCIDQRNLPALSIYSLSIPLSALYHVIFGTLLFPTPLPSTVAMSPDGRCLHADRHCPLRTLDFAQTRIQVRKAAALTGSQSMSDMTLKLISPGDVNGNLVNFWPSSYTVMLNGMNNVTQK